MVSSFLLSFSTDMVINVLLLLYCIFIIIAAAAFISRKARNKQCYPPGPFSWPLLGNMKELQELSRKLGGLHKAVLELSRRYRSPVVSLRFGGATSKGCFVVNGVKYIHAVLEAEEYAGRPWNYFVKLRNLGHKKGISMNDGKNWQEIRGWFVKSMHSMGFAKREMSDILKEELELVLQQIGEVDGSVKQMKPIIVPIIINVLWTFAAGKRFDETKLQYFIKLMERRAQAFDLTGGLLAAYPWIRFVAPNYSGYNLLMTVNQEFRSILVDVIDEHKKKYIPGTEADLIDVFLKEMYAGKADFDDDQLITILLDVLLAGLNLTATALEFLFLHILINQDAQKLLHEEIDRVIGRERLPDISDRTKMPYAEAVIMESLRLTPVMPVIGPRRVIRDTQLLGFSVPRDTYVLMNIHSIHSDPKLYPKPGRFRPERFLQEDHLLRDDNLLFFGKGKRQCPGISLAKTSLFVVFVGIMQRYMLLPVPGKPPPSLQVKAGMTMAAQPFDVFLVSRRKDLASSISMSF